MRTLSNWKRRSAWAGAVAMSVMATMAFVGPVSGQEAEGLRLVFGLAYEQGGPGPTLVDELRAADLGDVREGTCAAATCAADVPHPFYYDEGLNIAALVGARYRFAAPVSIEALFSNGARGHAEGYNADDKEHLVVAYTSFMVTTTIGAHVGPVRLEAGPVVNATMWEATRNSGQAGSRTTSMIGATAGVSGGLRLEEVLLSIKAGVRRFPQTDLRTEINVPITADYQSFFIGLTATPVGD